MGHNRDSAHLRQLDGIAVHPILIMGLHRSGTTWLYETLASLLPVATLSVYDIVHYGELLAAQADGSATRLRAAIDEGFGAARTRGFDDVALSHATLDEYGYVLRRHAGRALIDSRTLPTFDELVRKLAVLQGRPHVLLKNPWDTRQGRFIAEQVPGAKFIFIRRDPARVVDSVLRMVEGSLAGENPLLKLLLDGVQPEEAIFAALRRVRRIVGERPVRSVLLRLIENHVRGETRHYRAALAAIPKERRVEVEYEALIAAPGPVLQRILHFVGLPLVRPADSVIAKPRRGELLPEVAARADRLRASISALLPVTAQS